MSEVERLEAKAAFLARVAAHAKTPWGRTRALKQLAHVYQQLDQAKGDT